MAKGSNITAKDVLYVGGALVAFTLIRNVLIRAGIAAGPGSQSASTQITDPRSYWKPTFYRTQAGARLITRARAELFAKRIHDAFGIFQDDFNAVMSIFSQVPSKAAVSWLSDVFQQKYKQDLLTFLTNGGGILPWDGLSDAQLKQLLDLTNKLPNK